MKKYLCMALMLAVLLTPVFAEEAQDPAVQYPYAEKIVNLVHSFWEATAQQCEGEITDEEYTEKLDEIYAEAKVIAQEIIDAFKKGDHTKMEQFAVWFNSDAVQNQPEIKDAVSMLMIGDLREFLMSRNLTPDTYFPGWGYPNPDCVYRLGEEISTDVLSVYWQSVKKTLEEGEKYIVNIEVGAELGGGLDIKPLGIPFELKIDGKYVKVQKCEVTCNETTVTTSTQKFQKVKKWFKLYEAEKTWLGHEDWHEVGKTYKIFEEESGLPVVDDPPVVH